MKYFKVEREDGYAPLEEIFKKASEVDDSIMLVGDHLTKYRDGDLNLIDLVKLISLKKRELFLSSLDINASFDYFQLFELDYIQQPILLNCISFCKERLAKEGLILEENLFASFKEADIGVSKIIVKIYGGYPDILEREFEENVKFIKNNNLGNICLDYYPYNFSAVNYHLFRKYIQDDTEGMLSCPPLCLPLKNDLE